MKRNMLRVVYSIGMICVLVAPGVVVLADRTVALVVTLVASWVAQLDLYRSVGAS